MLRSHICFSLIDVPAVHEEPFDMRKFAPAPTNAAEPFGSLSKKGFVVPF